MLCDLKAAFGQKKDGRAEEEEEEEEETSWDRRGEAKGAELPESLHPGVAEGESSGFHFSFFGDEADAGGPEAGRSGGGQAEVRRRSGGGHPSFSLGSDASSL